MAEVIPVEYVEKRILELRGVKAIIGPDLAELYGVTTRRLNEQVRRNRDRFPEDFAFQLSQEEKEKVVANCDHLANLRFSPYLPYAFTEHRAIMAAFHGSARANAPEAKRISGGNHTRQRRGSDHFEWDACEAGFRLRLRSISCSHWPFIADRHYDLKITPSSEVHL